MVEVSPESRDLVSPFPERLASPSPSPSPYPYYEAAEELLVSWIPDTPIAWTALGPLHIHHHQNARRPSAIINAPVSRPGLQGIQISSWRA